MTDGTETLADGAAMSHAREWTREAPTGLLVLADGTVIEGKGAGADAPVHAPGAAFFAAGVFGLASLAIYWAATREPRGTGAPVWSS